MMLRSPQMENPGTSVVDSPVCHRARTGARAYVCSVGVVYHGLVIPGQVSCRREPSRTPFPPPAVAPGVESLSAVRFVRFPFGVPHEPNRGPVSSPRLVKRSTRVSRTTFSYPHRVKAYVAYRVGRAFTGANRRTGMLRKTRPVDAEVAGLVT